MPFLRALTGNRLWNSIVRHGVLPTNRNRVMLVMENLFLHLHSAKVRRRNLEFSSTY